MLLLQAGSVADQKGNSDEEMSMFLKIIVSLVPTGGSSSLLYLILFCVIQDDVNCSYRITRLYFCPLGLRHHFR